jgi:hypothetical protein
MRLRTMRYFLAPTLVLVFAFSARVFADQGPDRLQRGIAAHNAISGGDDGRIEEALALLGPEGWQRPPLALAYHGSVLTLEASKARREGKLGPALKYIEDGVKEIDEALSLDPASVELRCLRMENSMALVETSPSDRKEEVAEDISFLRGKWDSLGGEIKALVELDSGRLSLARKRLGEALASWRKAVRESPDSGAAVRARKLLSRYGS